MIITKHAIKRVKERTGLKKKLSEKLLTRALENGIMHKEVKGSFRKYLDWLYFHNGANTNVRVYNNYVFICTKEVFITIVPLPKRYKDIAHKLQEIKKGEIK